MDEKCCCYEKEGDNPDCQADHMSAHVARHRELHAALDELVADFISHTGKVPSQTTVFELMKWSAKQTTDPDDGVTQ